MRPCFFIVALVLVIAILPGCMRPTPVAAPTEIKLLTEDAWTLPATFSPATTPDAPALILLHRYAHHRGSWSPYTPYLKQTGYTTLSLDFRGHGDAKFKGETKSYKTFQAEDWKKALYDLRAARDFLISQGTPPDKIALIGEDIGANLALHYTLKDPQIAALIMISPGLDYHGIQTQTQITQLKEQPLLLMTGEQDSYAAASALTLHEKAPNFAELRTYASSAHGTDLLAAKPDALQQIILWLNTTVPTIQTRPGTPSS